MKISIYTIALNEEKFVERFMSTIKNEADDIYVLDTGSTDKTVQALQDLGANVKVGITKPWRFDTPRNVSLAMVPENTDICLSIDLDETLTPGWRKCLEDSWLPETTRMRYQYAWSHNADGSPATCFWYDKCHQRTNYRGVKPVHEVLTIYNQHEVQNFCDGFMLHHWPDPTKSRGSYLPLLELAVKEEPYDDRSCHYLGREYMYYGAYDQAIVELKRHLSLPSATWDSERAASMRFIARCYTYKHDLANAHIWALKSCAEQPNEREPWFEMVKVGYYLKDFEMIFHACKQLFKFTDKGRSYISDPDAWGYLPHDYYALAAWNLRLKQIAMDQGLLAVQIAERTINDPDTIARLKTNLSFYTA